jgi:DNA-binding NarL/FixJ family response regulator
VTAAKPIRLVLAGNNTIVLACLERLFAMEENFAVVARCGRGEDVLGVLRALQPDILLLDLPPSFRERLALLHGMKEAAVPTRVIFLAETLGEGELAHATRLGVRGIVPKEVAPHLLAQCIRNVHAGGVWLRGTAAFPATGRPTATVSGALTPREIEIVRLICGGLGNRQIAKQLRIGEATVKTHLHQIYEKLRLRDRLQLGLYGRQRGLTSTNRSDLSE